MKFGILIYTILICSSCTSQDSVKGISKITLYPIEMNVENPNIFPNELTVIVINRDEIYKIVEKYKNEELISTDTLKIISNDYTINNHLNNLPNDYFLKDMRFGRVNIADEGALGVTIEFADRKQIIWEISITDRDIDPEFFFKKYHYQPTKIRFRQNRSLLPLFFRGLFCLTENLPSFFLEQSGLQIRWFGSFLSFCISSSAIFNNPKNI